MDQIRWIIYGIYTIAPPPPEKNCPPVRDGVWVKIRVNFMVGGGGATRQLPTRKTFQGDNSPRTKIHING